jgi:hypothetical protein
LSQRKRKPFFETYPELVNQWNTEKNTNLSISDYISGNTEIWWNCEKKHEWKTNIYNRKGIRGTKCPICLNRKILIGYNDLATTNPILAKEWHPTLNGNLKPTDVFEVGKQKVWWLGKCGHEWESALYSRAIGSQCSICHNRTLLVGVNDLATQHPELAKEWHPTLNGDLKPTQIFGFARKSYWWFCENKHEWYASVYHRVNQKCPYCRNRKIWIGYNDLKTTHPEVALEAFGWDPTKYFAGNIKRFKWKCKKGHIWNTSINSRTQGTGCPSCANYGFDPNQKGYIYFLIHTIWEMYQIGITNFPDERLKSHKRNGFELLEIRGPMDGHAAREIETAILRYLKNQKADLSPEHVAGKFDGYSESWTIDSYKVNNLKELIDKAREAGY